MSIKTFLSGAIETVCKTLELKDLSDEALKTHPGVVLEVNKAYAQIAAFAARPFHRVLLLDRHPEFEQGEELRQKSNAELVSIEWGGELLSSADYSLEYGKLFMEAIPPADITVYDTALFIKYTAGFNRSEDNNILHQCIVLQALANFNRRKAVGISAGVLGKETDSKTGSDGLMPDVKELLTNGHLLYYGTAESVSETEAADYQS